MLRQGEWNAEYYLRILRESGLTMTEEQCRALASSDVAPTDEQLLGRALHAEFLDRLEADCSARSAADAVRAACPRSA
jgi:hypothetical protein